MRASAQNEKNMGAPQGSRCASSRPEGQSRASWVASCAVGEDVDGVARRREGGREVERRTRPTLAHEIHDLVRRESRRVVEGRPARQAPKELPDRRAPVRGERGPGSRRLASEVSIEVEEGGERETCGQRAGEPREGAPRQFLAQRAHGDSGPEKKDWQESEDPAGGRRFARV